MKTETADTIVVGLGAVGAAAAHRLALMGADVIGIDRFHPPHDHGSSHGESRISRLAVGEGAAYAPLVRRSHQIWRELEALSGENLFLQTGGLTMGPRDGAAQHHGKGDFVRRTVAVAQTQGIAHEVLDAAEIASRFPQFLLRGDEMACYEPTAGVIFPERCIAVQLRLAKAHGAKLHLNERVQAITSENGGVKVQTDQRILHAGRVLLTAGPWTADLAGGRIAKLAKVYRQTLHWFEAADPAQFAPGRFPVFIWMHGEGEEDYLYGFPSLYGAGAIKVASERYAAPVKPDAVDRFVSAAESAEMFARHVRDRLSGVGPNCVGSAACFYTVTPDAGFLIDESPDHPNVLVASACSGHGFKHSAGVGEMLANRVLAPKLGVSDTFSLARFAQNPF